PPFDQSEAVDVPFVAAFEQQLHAEADAKRGLTQRLQGFPKAQAVDALHGVRRRADAGKDDSVSRNKHLGIGGNVRADAQPLERELDRTDIAVSEIDDDY